MEALENLILNSKYTKRDFKKIESMIFDSVMEEVQKQMDEWGLDRLFIQLNQE